MFFKEGDIVRYDEGSTALMKITHISIKNGGARYYGTQCMGGNVGAYSYDVTHASELDLKEWKECSSWRQEAGDSDA